MSNLWLNWRFGKRHLQIGKWFIRLHYNSWWEDRDYGKWFERY